MTEGTVCIPNIGKKGRQQRLMFGFFGLAAAIIVTVLLVATGAPLGARVLTFLPFFAGMLGVFQYLEKT